MVIPKKDPLFLAAEHLAKSPPKDGYLFGHYGRTKYEAENLVKEANGIELSDGTNPTIYRCKMKLRKPKSIHDDIRFGEFSHGLSSPNSSIRRIRPLLRHSCFEDRQRSRRMLVQDRMGW